MDTCGKLPNPIFSAFFSPDSKRLVISSGMVARVWDVADCGEYLALTGHTGAVKSASYSPDGRFMVTSSVDITARIWDATTGEARTTLRGHNGFLNGAAYRPDGRSIVTSSDDRTARQYCIDIVDLLKLAQSRLASQLTTGDICAP